MGRRGCGEYLLDFLAAGEMREDGGAFNSAGAFEVQARGPRGGVRVLCGAVAGAEVERCYFILGFERVGWAVD